jgi:hypothetical protein
LYGGSGNDEIRAVAATPDGGLLAAGRSTSSDGDVEFNRGDLDAWLLKLDRQGNIEWRRSFGGSDWEWINSVAPTSDGGAVVAGDARSIDGDFDRARPNDGPTVWAARLDSRGETAWLRIFDNEGCLRSEDVSEAPDGGVVIAGMCDPVLTPCQSCRPGGAGENSIRALRLDADGYSVSRFCYTLPEGASALVASLAPDGGIVATYTVPIAGAVNETRITGVDAEGNLAFEIALSEDGKSLAALAPVAHGGGLIGAGSATVAGGRVPWLARIGNDGGIAWDTLAGEGAASGVRDRLRGAAQAEGGFFAAGSTEGHPHDPEDRGEDLLAVMADSDGGVVWTAVLGGSGRDGASAAAVAADGGPIAAGEARSADGDLALRAEGEGDPSSHTDGWIVKFRNP